MSQQKYPIGIQSFPSIIDISPRTVYIIGANFNENKDKRGLEYEIVKR